MAEQRESSFLFSLKGLMGVARHEREAEARRLTLEETQEAHREVATFERQRAERARRRAEHAARADELRQEAAQRRELIQLGLVERARLEAESRLRLELIERQKERDSELRRRRERQLTLGVLGATLAVLLAALALYFGKLRPESERLQRAYDDLVAAERASSHATRALLDRADRQRQDAADELARTRRKLDAAERRIRELERRRRSP